MRLRNLGNDRRGGIEGLPLQLMIVILVATMGTAIIVGWMGNIETPKSIGDVDVPDRLVRAEGGVLEGLTIQVRDQDGGYLEGAVVAFQSNYVKMDDGNGNPVSASAVTGPDGKVTFDKLYIDAPGNTLRPILEILVYKSGYGEKTVDIMVDLS